MNALLAVKAEEFRLAGRKPYFWDPPRVVPLAAVSYTLCMAEIAEQCETLGLTPDALYVSSAGATGAGVALGKTLLGLPYPVRLICPMHWPWDIPTRAADDANAAAKLLGLPHRLAPAEIDADESHVAPGYAQPSPTGQEAMHLLATTEAILLDRVYTARPSRVRDVGREIPPGGTSCSFLGCAAFCRTPQLLKMVIWIRYIIHMSEKFS